MVTLINKTLTYKKPSSYSVNIRESYPIKEDASIIALSISLFYLLLLPEGMYGIALALLALLLGIYGINIETAGVCCLLFGMPSAGALANAFGLHGAGGKISLLIGLILLFGFRSSMKEHKHRLKGPVIWLTWTMSILLLAYYHGPQSEYARSKLFWFIANTTITMIALYFIIGNPKVNLMQLANLSVICSIVYYSTCIHVYPFFRPENIFVTGGIRSAISKSEVYVSPNTLSYLTSIGIAFSLGIVIDKKLYRQQAFNFFLILFVGLLVIHSCGQRKYLPFPLIAAISLLFCRPKNKALVIKIIMLMSLFFGVLILVAMVNEVGFITEVFDKDETIFHRLNRDTTWDAAFLRVKERPFFGYGLGGFYVDKYAQASNRYAHNLLLELLSETGIVGTLLILAPPILFFFIPARKNIFSMRTIAGATLVPFFLLVCINAMLSAHIGKSCIVFAVVAAVWAYSGINLKTKRL